MPATTTDPAWGRVVARVVVWTAVFVGAGYVGRATIIDGSALSLVWPAAGVAVLWICTSSRRTVAIDLAAFALAGFVVNATTGALPALALVFMAANLLQVAVVVTLARRWIPEVWGFGGRRALGRLDELLRLVLAALIACLVAATFGSIGLELLTGGGSWLTFVAWWGRNTVGVVSVGLVGLLAGPALASAYRRRGGPGVWSATWRSLRPRSPARAAEVVLLGSATAAVYLVVFTADEGPALAFLVLVPTFWAGIRFTPLAAVIHSLACASSAVSLTLLGSGPFLSFHEPTARALVAQLCVLITMVAGLSLAFSHAQERAVAAELRSLMDASRLVALLASDEDGRVRTFGVGAERLLGYAASEVVGRVSPSSFIDAGEIAAAAVELGVRPAEVLAELARREGEPRTWTFHRKDGHELSAQLALSELRADDGSVSGFLGVAIDVTDAVRDQAERERLQQQLAHLAHHDLLTGLPNRRWFEDVLRDSLASQRSGEEHGALLMLDLDRFKAVNDTLGHAAGDALLVSVADVLRGRMRRHTDAVARLGGDEFAILLGTADRADAERTAQSLVSAVREHTATLGPVLDRVTLSIGGVMVGADDATTLLHAADAALYRAKHAGRDRQVIDPGSAMAPVLALRIG